jgi:hypothetical protein
VTTPIVMDLNGDLSQALNDGTNDYIYGNGRIAQVNTTTLATSFFLTDALGSARRGQLADSSGAVTFAQSYSPYGTASFTSGNASGYGFTNEYQDSYIKFIYLRSRMYST